MKKRLLTFFSIAFLSLVTFSSCSDKEGETIQPEEETKDSITFDDISVSDQENLNNSSDLLLSYSIEGDIDEVEEIRILMSKSSLTLQEAIEISNDHYQVFTTTELRLTSLGENLTDIDGDMIEEGTSYRAYLLVVFQNDQVESILSPESTITLSNEIVVTTPLITGSFNATEDIVIASDGTLYANGGGSSESNLYKVTADGVGTVLSNAQNGAVGIALDEEGNIYSSNFNSTVIQKVTPSGVSTDFMSDSQLVGGGGLAFDNDGNLFNTFYASKSLFRITSDGMIEIFTTSNSFNGPVGMTYDKEGGKLYVSSFNDGKIFNVSSSGSVTQVADTPASIGHLSYSTGYFYVTGWNEHQVFQVSLDGKDIVTIGSGDSNHRDGTASSASFINPNGIEATADGKYVYVTQGNGQLRKIIMAREE